MPLLVQELLSAQTELFPSVYSFSVLSHSFENEVHNSILPCGYPSNFCGWTAVRHGRSNDNHGLEAGDSLQRSRLWWSCLQDRRCWTSNFICLCSVQVRRNWYLSLPSMRKFVKLTWPVYVPPGDYGMSTWVTLSGGTAWAFQLDGIIYRTGYALCLALHVASANSKFQN